MLSPLISDLGLILLTAGAAVLLFRKIRQPLVLGYLIAGFLAGNHFDFFPSVQDIHSVEVWAEIGIIFLLFNLGLEFSFRKLMHVGGTASVTALVQIVCMVIGGYFAGRALGWEPMDCIFLGVMLSISSTTIILKTFEELALKAQKFVGNVIGALIVQDLLAILMMVMLSTIAVSRQVEGMELVMTVLKLIFFLVLWFVSGIFFIPTLLKRSQKLLNDETTLILAIALCLMMVMLAADVGFSPALGAFMMGSIIAETTQAEHIEHLMKPVKDLFGAVFFVSVGMLIDPATLVEHWKPVLVLTLVVIVGQSLSAASGALLSGRPLTQSVQTGMSLSQIGEFSFIIATMGASLKVTSAFLYPIIVAVSAITTFTTPFMVRYSAPFAGFLQRKLPRKWLRRIERYAERTNSGKSASNWQIVIRAYLVQVLVHSVIIISLILLAGRYLLPLGEGSITGTLLVAVLTLLLLSPFLWALSMRRVATEQVNVLLQERRYRGPLILMILFRFLLTLFYVGFLVDKFFSAQTAFVVLGAAVVLYWLFPKKLNARYHRLEERFLKNLNAREIIQAKWKRSDLTPWDGHMEVFKIGKESNLAGLLLRELQLREQFGINIVFIKRGHITITIPSRNERLFPGDEICIMGNDTQVEAFRDYLEHNEHEPAPDEKEHDIILLSLVVLNPAYIGVTIKESALREKTHGLIVGLERRGRRVLNPESNVVLEEHDILWIVGERNLLEASDVAQTEPVA
ncbi:MULTISPECIES: cation:proton antiporter [unclassified Flavobacterium]|uniref:cation:proton antiporter n=1 Tax=unclassified Flavobacterium TaxID=196869 RepID=UPI001F12B2FA|nr:MULTISPECIES: cation:proton antiporter [unclassified Flavobacterium]UMY65169.1 cation:proton antiporter [Flavobacterium sp. HJ-32-4]